MSRPRKHDRHLPPCVYLRHGRYWYVKGGKWTDLGVTLAEALEAYARIIETPVGTMPALVDEAFDFMKKRKPPLAAATIEQYEDAAKILKRKLQQFRPEQVLMKHVASVKKSMVDTPNMANRCLSFLRSVFDYALEAEGWDEVEGNPAVGVKRYKERKRDRLLTPKERERIYAQSGDRLRVILDLMYLTGQRVNAVLRIQLPQLTEKGIRFPKFKTEAKGTVKWTPELRAVVERAKALRGNVRSLNWLLPGRPGKPPDYRSVFLQFKNACEAAGVEDAQMRDYRAASATEAEEQGLDPTALLMHTNEQQTRRYLRGKKEPLVEGPSFGRPLDDDEKAS